MKESELTFRPNLPREEFERRNSWLREMYTKFKYYKENFISPKALISFFLLSESYKDRNSVIDETKVKIKLLEASRCNVFGFSFTFIAFLTPCVRLFSKALQMSALQMSHPSRFSRQHLTLHKQKLQKKKKTRVSQASPSCWMMEHESHTVLHRIRRL